MILASWLDDSPTRVADSVTIDTAAVRQAIATVFADDAYTRSLTDTLWSRVQHWIVNTIGSLLSAVGESAPVKWALIAAAVLVLAAFVARIAYAASAGIGAGPHRRRPAADRSLDPLLLARAAAADGRFMDAAHLLCVAILDELRQTERLIVDPSKTLGDYRRDLATRSSRALKAFREFTNAYEAIVWGRRGCDAPGYERLVKLATPLMPRADPVASSL